MFREFENILRKIASGFLSAQEKTYFRELIAEEGRVVGYMDDYLKSVGSPESLRLASDLQKNRMKKNDYLQNGHNLHDFYMLAQNDFVFKLSNIGIEYRVCKNLKKFKRPYNLPSAFRGWM